MLYRVMMTMMMTRMNTMVERKYHQKYVKIEILFETNVGQLVEQDY
jgi:hypothetical protein